MAKGTVIAEPPYVAAVTAALRRRYRGADVSYEQIRRDRYRFIVVSKRFDGLGHPERQRAVWDLMEQAVAREDLLKIGMIITMSPQEASMSNRD
jgi:acid stress-induced BolA-like protein IbaG/YrbA